MYNTKIVEDRFVWWKCLSNVIISFVFLLHKKVYFSEYFLVKSSGQT